MKVSVAGEGKRKEGKEGVLLIITSTQPIIGKRISSAPPFL